MEIKYIDVNFQLEDQKFRPNFGMVQPLTKYVDGEPYEGEYEVTPKGYAQTLHTAGKLLNKNITVEAIPSRYGLITYTQDRIVTVT
jgi:hypothetical protein